MSKPSVREHLFATLVQCLGKGGVAENDGLTAQPGQADYAQRWAETISRALDARAQGDTRAHLLMSGADTGTGKTIGYALPALTAAAMGHRVGVATNSHQLQRQMLGQNGQQGDLPRVAKWLYSLGHGNLSFARRVGRQAFVSAAAVELALSSLSDEPRGTVSAEDIEQIHELHDWAMQSNLGRNSGLIEDAQEHFGGRLPGGLSAEAVALDADCPAADHAAYEAHLEAAEHADVVLMTHQYLATCAMFRGGRLSERGFSLLVVDEADMLRDAADACFRFNLSLARLTNLLQLAPGKAAKSAAQAASELLQVAGEAMPSSGLIALAMDAMPADARRKLEQGVRRLAKAVKEVPISKQSDAGLAQALGEASTFLARLGRLEPGELFAAAISWSPSRKFTSLSMLPNNPGVLLRALWRRDSDSRGGEMRDDIAAVLFTSATLGTPGNALEPVDRFKDIAYALGVPTASNDKAVVDTSLWAQFEPVKFGAVRFILADPSVEHPVTGVNEDSSAQLSEVWVQYVAAMAKAASAAGGRTLVLTRSYRDNAILANELRQQGVCVIEQSRSYPKDVCIGEFRDSTAAVWLSPTAWEGLNLPGLIANLVIARVPFQRTDEVGRALLIAQGRMNKVAAERIANAKAMRDAKRLLRQGMGRAVRTRTDKARIWIADPRFPLPASSPIPAMYPEKITWADGRTYPALHHVVPNRFRQALERCSVFLRNGEVLDA